jgi:predicted  nucleic acid-binding Zn-ribbon protein
MAKAKKDAEVAEMTVAEKLQALYELQQVDTAIDKIKILRGELPLEVQDLEDEIEGLQTRVSKYDEDITDLEKSISGKKQEITNAQELIKKYEEQQNNVRNNREYDSLSKEIEFQTLEIELSEKRIREFTSQIDEKKVVIGESTEVLEGRKQDLENKKKELEEIIGETQKEEEVMEKKSAELEGIIEERLISAYKKIRGNARNGLAVVPIERDACGGCFNKIPPQRQLDIASKKKIIVCEYCGRILVDPRDHEAAKK